MWPWPSYLALLNLIKGGDNTSCRMGMRIYWDGKCTIPWYSIMPTPVCLPSPKSLKLSLHWQLGWWASPSPWKEWVEIGWAKEKWEGVLDSRKSLSYFEGLLGDSEAGMWLKNLLTIQLWWRVKRGWKSGYLAKFHSFFFIRINPLTQCFQTNNAYFIALPFIHVFPNIC